MSGVEIAVTQVGCTSRGAGGILLSSCPAQRPVAPDHRARERQSWDANPSHERDLCKAGLAAQAGQRWVSRIPPCPCTSREGDRFLVPQSGPPGPGGSGGAGSSSRFLAGSPVLGV